MDSVSPVPSATRVVMIGEVAIGGADITVIAGPCSVEPDYVAHAKAVASAGADILRGSVYKPRSAPDRFQGIGAEGIPLLDEARQATSLPVISEPLDSGDMERLSGHVDGFLIGARSMRNSRLLHAAGEIGIPVVLKRAFSATYDELIGAADYIRAAGNDNVVLCERGIRTFNTDTRNTLDIAAVAVLRGKTDLPVIVDPSHSAGRREWVGPLAHAAAGIGADGLIVESHPRPDESWTDSEQALDTPALSALIKAVRAHSAFARTLLA